MVSDFPISKIIQELTPNQFKELALELFQYQAKNNSVYCDFLTHLNIDVQKIANLKSIPFLPISLFKTHKLKTNNFEPEITFLSSATAGQKQSNHFVKSTEIYEESFIKGFENLYGPIKNLKIFGLLPSYLERSGSSLVYMVKKMIEISQFEESGFFLNDFEALKNAILTSEKEKQPYLLIGVSFALLDFSEKFNFSLNHAIVMETGGMKGRRKEITRSELHETLKNSFGVKQIHSEYGMTELLSQAYAKQNGIFETPPWMKVFVRETNDPLATLTKGRGGLNIIDLANVDSCAFIATEDLGNLYPNGTFEVLGRFDNAEVRGCNLMVF